MPILPLQSLAGSSIDHIVSLGRACGTAYNLRRHYGFATAYPFDWWISPTAGVARFLGEGDAGALYDPAALRLSPDGNSVMHAQSGIRLHHEFPRDWRGEKHLVAADWAQHIDRARQRTAHVADRFFGLAATAGTVVFLRAFSPRDSDAPAVEDMLKALERRFPAQRSAVVLANYRGATPQAAPVHRITVAGRAGTGWRGDPEAWDAALGTLGLRLTPGLHRPPAAKDLSAQQAANAAPE